MFFYYDWTYILVLIGAVICMIASANVKSTYNRYANVRSMTNMTGAQVAERLLRSAGLYDVKVGQVRGELSDHYNPATKVVNLSDSVYGSTSVAAIGVAAHECGHAIQHAKGYFPLNLRTWFVPIANFGSKMAWPLILVGLFINSQSSQTIINLGIILFSFAVIFQIITLPVEFNASSRALALLEEQGILSSQELPGTKKVLGAAALTYVASVASAILQLLRIIVLFGGRRRNDRR